MSASNRILSLTLLGVLVVYGAPAFSQEGDAGPNAGDRLYKVDFTLADSTNVNAIQVAIRYPLGTGRLLGESDAVRCTPGDGVTGHVALNHCPFPNERGCVEGGVLYASVISITPLPAGQPILSCEYASAHGTPASDEFRTEVLEAVVTSPNGIGVEPVVAKIGAARVQLLSEAAQ